MTIGALRILDGDLLGICARLRAIDGGYFAGYNVARQRFEVHNKNQRGGTLALIVPYPELDERTVRLVLKTRCERKKELLAEMERENAAHEKSLLRECILLAQTEVERLLYGGGT